MKMSDKNCTAFGSILSEAVVQSASERCLLSGRQFLDSFVLTKKYNKEKTMGRTVDNCFIRSTFLFFSNSSNDCLAHRQLPLYFPFPGCLLPAFYCDYFHTVDFVSATSSQYSMCGHYSLLDIAMSYLFNIYTFVQFGNVFMSWFNTWTLSGITIIAMWQHSCRNEWISCARTNIFQR